MYFKLKEANYNHLIYQAHELIGQTTFSDDYKQPVKVGVDLGTSSVVLVILDYDNIPIFVDSVDATVVKDGLVIDYIGAIDIVRKLKNKAENSLNINLNAASGAVPPGTIGKNYEVIGNVIESADMKARKVVDEPLAAAKTLGITNGHIVDVGGGTTGIASIYNSEIVQSVDEPTGGFHMNLVLAGRLNTSVEEAEKLKREDKVSVNVLATVKPVIEKMATIAKQAIDHVALSDELPVYIVGGASRLTGFKDIFEKTLNREAIQTIYPELITPIGIALHDVEGDPNG